MVFFSKEWSTIALSQLGPMVGATINGLTTSDAIPSTLARPGAAPFWIAVLLTGAGTGIAAAALTRLLELVQRAVWGGTGTNVLEAAQQAGAWRHVLVLIGAGVVTGAGQILL